MATPEKDLVKFCVHGMHMSHLLCPHASCLLLQVVVPDNVDDDMAAQFLVKHFDLKLAAETMPFAPLAVLKALYCLIPRVPSSSEPSMPQVCKFAWVAVGRQSKLMTTLFCSKHLCSSASTAIAQEETLPVQINPVTAYGFLEVIQVPEGEYLLQQAANSVLGKELISMAQKRGTKTINLVRRHEVVDELKQLGYVYTSSTSQLALTW